MQRQHRHNGLDCRTPPYTQRHRTRVEPRRDVRCQGLWCVRARRCVGRVSGTALHEAEGRAWGVAYMHPPMHAYPTRFGATSRWPSG